MKKDTRAKPPRSNWAISQRNSSSAGLYSLALFDFSSDAANELAYTAFAFKVNPKSMNLEEPAAVTVVPTQNQSQFIEHQGQIYKNIQISGTTGLRPNRQEGSFFPLGGVGNQVSNFASSLGINVDPQTHLPRGENTGFDDIIELRNLFRVYWDRKEDPNIAPTTVMVWQNGKEGEYFVVEPITFKTTRDASSPLTFNYEIQLRTIGKLELVPDVRDPYAARNSSEAFLQRISDTRRQIIGAFQIAGAFTDRAVTIGQAAITGVLQPVNDVIQALTGVISSGSRVFSVPRNALAVIATNSNDLATAFDGLAVAYKTAGVSDQMAEVANAYKRISRSMYQLAVEDQLFTTQLSSTVAAKLQAYTNPITGLPKSGGSQTYLGNVRTTNAAGVATVFDGDTIHSLALRLLGDSASWKPLVLLNQLRPPYISAAGDGINVLRPGDQILFPQSAAAGDSAISAQDQKFLGMTPLNDRLGRDLKLVSPQSAGAIVVYDLAKASSGDLDTIVGFPNLNQAVIIKFSTEQRELPTHAFFGIKYPTGTKARVQALINFQIGARATFLSDRRIASVDQLDVSVSGNVLNVEAAVSVQGVDQALALDFSIRS